MDPEKPPTESHQEKPSVTGFCHQRKHRASFTKPGKIFLRMDQETRCKRGPSVLTALMLSGIFFPLCLKMDHKATMKQTDRWPKPLFLSII